MKPALIFARKQGIPHMAGSDFLLVALLKIPEHDDGIKPDM